MQDTILTKAIELFKRYGLRPVSMDDLSRELGVSKKTLYQHFESKEDLVHQAVMMITSQVTVSIRSLQEQGYSAIDELFALDETCCRTVEEYDHSLEFQLRKYYPKVYDELEEYRRKSITESIKANLRKGIEEDLYRSDLDVAVITRLYYSHMLIFSGMESDPFKNFEIRDVMHETLIYHLRGICSRRGLQVLEAKLASNSQES